MAQVIIQPAAGTDAQQHLQDTINSYVPMDRLEQHLDPPDLDRGPDLVPFRRYPSLGSPACPTHGLAACTGRRPSLLLSPELPL
mgnify:CR=1 FL=1